MPLKNKEKRKEYYRKWLKTESGEIHKNRRRAYNRRWRKENPEKHNEEQRKYRERNPQRRREIAKKCRIKHAGVYSRIRHYRERGAIGSHTLEDWEDIKKEFNYCCAICGRQEPFTDLWYPWLTEDHIIPISKGGANWIKNIQPLCITCNTKKGQSLERSN